MCLHMSVAMWPQARHFHQIGTWTRATSRGVQHPMATQPHVVFMNMAAIGHMNPTLPVVAELARRGCKVTYFVEDSMRTVVEAAGAAWRPFRYSGSTFTGIFRNPQDFTALGAASLSEVGVPLGTTSRVWLPCKSGVQCAARTACSH
jgi:hypothetical protein